MLSKSVFRTSRNEEFIQESWEQHREESARRRQQVLPVFWKHRRDCETPAPEPAREDAEQRSGGAREGTPQNVRFDTPSITGERVQSVKMNFIEKTGKTISEEDAQYFEGYEKTVWMRQARIRTFKQLELEACEEEIIWVVRCHNCEAFNRPQEEYPARPLPIRPNYIDNFQSRLIKVRQ